MKGIRKESPDDEVFHFKFFDVILFSKRSGFHAG